MADKKGKTKEKILKAALKVFSEKGYHATNVDDIVEKSETSKGGFYFHFPSKKELFLTLIDEMTAILFDKVEKEVEESDDVVEQIEKALWKGMHVFTKYRTLAKFLLVEAVGSGSVFEKKRFAIYTRFAALIKELLDKAVSQGKTPPLDTEVVSWIWVGAISQLIIRWLYLEESKPLEKDFETLKETLMRSVGLGKEGNLSVSEGSA
jgi:AcrR family transcriptional regulator